MSAIDALVDAADEIIEAAGLINLSAVAATIAKSAPRPLFTLIPPSAEPAWEALKGFPRCSCYRDVKVPQNC